MIVAVGIDPGQRHCAYAVVGQEGAGFLLLAHGEVSLSSQRGARQLREFFVGAGVEYSPIGVAAEDASKFVAAHGRSVRQGLRVRTGQDGACGRVREMAEAAGLRWLGRINTSQVKAAMGHGRANKEAMISLARMRFGVDVSDHVADAIGVALAALRKNEHQQLVRAYSARNNSRRA